MLPKLPKQNKSPEALFGIEFRRWWETHKMSGSFETKHTRGKDYFNLSEWHAAQRVIAKLIRGPQGVLLRISSGTEGIPDYIGLITFPAYLVIKYPTFFCIIDTDFLKGEESITSIRAKEIAKVIHMYKNSTNSI